MIRRFIVAVVLLTLALSAASVSLAQTQITAFAASSLQEPMQDIAAAFQQAHPDVTVAFNFAGSSALATQIAEGAPADVFASADARQMNNAVDSGRIDAGSPQVFAHNRLALITPPDNPAGITSFRDLANPGVRLVLAADGVPVRSYTDTMLARLAAFPQIGPAFRDAVLANVVSEEDNVRQVALRVQFGEADAGIVYVTDALVEPGAVNILPLPRFAAPRASYVIAPLNDGAAPEDAQAFIDFVLSADGQAILASYGFEPVTTAAS